MPPSLRHWLHARRYPLRYGQLEQLLRNQALSREQLLAQHARDLAAIVAHAHHNVPYYRERFAGLDAAAFDELPLLSKDAVASRLDDLLADDADRAQAKLGHTGGSTGKPLAFWYDEYKHELMRAGMMRGFMMSGWRPGQKVMYFWGARHDTRKGGVFGGGWGDLVSAEKTIAAVEYSEAKLHEWARAIQAWRPTLLYGYASAMSELARHILANRLSMPDSLIGVYSTAEMLDDSQREVMQQAYGCKVFNQYGCREVPNIAWECRHGRMHVFADLVHLESVEIEGEDRFLVTSLSNRQMPFIRYDVGDSGRLLEGDCPCGSPFPLMEMGLCRKNDLIRTRAGATFHPAYFNRLLYGMTRIRQYQWVQTALDRLELNLVAAEPLSTEAVASLRASLARDVDPAMTLEVNQVEEIPRTVSGKHRFVIGLK